MYICIDFDGTCVKHEFPEVGDTNPGSVEVLQDLVKAGHQLILFTMRSNVTNPQSDGPDILNRPGNYLDDAIKWFDDNQIPLYGIQTNPTQSVWTTSPKAYGQVYIDDAALGCPLTADSHNSRPFVDWVEVRRLLQNSGML